MMKEMFWVLPHLSQGRSVRRCIATGCLCLDLEPQGVSVLYGMQLSHMMCSGLTACTVKECIETDAVYVPHQSEAIVLKED